MFGRFSTSRRFIASWIIGTALALLSVATVLADGSGSPFGH
jgi:hypothetical protein